MQKPPINKIVFVISFSSKPAEFENQPTPRFLWHNLRGEPIGIWGLEWGDLLLKALADYYPDYECEVWQPDLRADKTYSAELQPRLWHRNFPARTQSRVNRFRLVQETHSQAMIDEVGKHDQPDTVFMFPAQVYTKWLNQAISNVQHGRILYYNFLNARLMLPARIETSNPLKVLNRRWLNRNKGRWLMRIKNLLTSMDNPTALRELQNRFPDLRMFYFKMGMDMEFWSPVMNKAEARELLGINREPFVIVLSQRLVPEYQIDRFIEAVAQVRSKRVFSCFITGHGTAEYEEYLNSLVARHGLADRIKFVGFVSDEELRNYLIASDLFATFALVFAGSGGALKSAALGTPVLHVTSGSSYGFLREHGAGAFIDPVDYASWPKILAEIIDGRKVPTVSRQAVVDYYSWKSTAKELDFALKHLA